MIVLLDTSHNLDDCERELGCEVNQLLTPGTRFKPQRPEQEFAIDNSCYAGFDRAAFEALLERERPRVDLCRWVTCPAAEAIGIKAARFGWHTLRHLYGTLLRQAGATDLDHDRALGHRNRSMAAVYSQGDESARQERLARAAQEMVISGGNARAN